VALSDPEIEALRFELGYGNLGVGGFPYTSDGFQTLFYSVIAPNLTSGPETTATTAIVAGADATVTPVSMTGIVPYARLVVDVGDEAETVVVRSVTGSTFTARFANAHPATGYPIAVESGVTRLRQLMRDAVAAGSAYTGGAVTKAAGIKQVGQGEIEWFGAGDTLATMNAHLKAIRLQIAGLVRVPLAWPDGTCTQLEVY
jgi:hypothetical protein